MTGILEKVKSSILMLTSHHLAVFTFSKLTIETLEKDVKYVQT